jgi:hypothetical protein
MPYPIQTMKEFEAEERAPLPPSALAAFRRFDLGRGDGSKVPVSRQAVQYFAVVPPKKWTRKVFNVR